MKLLYLPLALLLWAVIGYAKEQTTTTSANTDKSGIIIQGYDVVSYFHTDGPQKGDTKIQSDHEGSTYLFANEANKEKFLKNPSQYAPQYGGWCAYAVADSKSKVDIDPKSFLIQDGRLLLFYKGLWGLGDTRTKWQKDEKNFLKKADINWPETAKKEP